MLLEVVLVVKAITGGFSLDVFTLIDWTTLALFTLLTVLYWVNPRQVYKAYDEAGKEDRDW